MLVGERKRKKKKRERERERERERVISTVYRWVHVNNVII